MGKHTEMDKAAAARIQSAAAKNPDSDSATSGFDSRAQSTADRRESGDDEAAEATQPSSSHGPTV